MKSQTPYIFYQTWKTKILPDKFKENQDKWLKALSMSNKKWEYRLLDDNDLKNLIKDNFPQYLDSYDKFSKPIERVDFARYVMMYLGGVYADLDTYPVNNETTTTPASDLSISDCMAKLEEYVDSGDIVLGREPVEHARELYDGRDVVLCNAFMISPPGKKLWIDFMDYIIANYEKNYRPVYNTGPMAMTLFMESNKEIFSQGVNITDPCVFFPMLGDGSISKRCLGPDEKLSDQTLVVHHWQNTWVTPWWQDKQWLNARYWFWGLITIFLIIWLRQYNKK